MEYYDGDPLRHMGDLPAMAAHRYGDRTALTAFGQTQSFAELDDEANRVANVLLDHGVEPDDRVGLFVPNSLQFPSAYFGAMRAGAVPVPLNLRMDPETLVFVLGDSDVEHLIGSPLLADETKNLAAAAEVGTTFLAGVSGEGIVNYSHALEEASGELDDRPERAYDDVACQPYTSGTTGRPKGVLLTHENLLSTIESYSKTPLRIDPDESILLVLPLFHIYALNALLGTFLYKGGSMVLQPRPEPAPMLEAIETHELTSFAGVPAMYTMMQREYASDPDAYDLSSLAEVTCAAAPLAEATRREIEDAWGVPMAGGWGMTETSPAGTFLPARGANKEAGCVGIPVPGVDLKLVDPETRETRLSADELEPRPDPEIDYDDERVTGEIAIRGPNVFEGYHNRPEKTEEVFDEEGWFYTEDIQRVDSDGYFWMVDRADDMMIVGGENVYPSEVEDALYDHSDVAEAAVVAADHEVKGQAPVAFVVVDEGTDLGEEELREFTLDHVASYAHPRRVFFVDELPRSATQKVQRFKLEDDAAGRLGEPLTSGERL
jgi:long-chain acyl-CoA synthetase